MLDSALLLDLPLCPAGAPGAHLEFDDGGIWLRRTILPGGVRVITETIPGAHSVAVGYWFGVGSRDETSGHHGSTHFLEHLLFKGTRQRSALDIAIAFDAIGGEHNAATAKEYTAYYARVLAGDLQLAVSVLSDMVTSAKLSDQDFNLERGVILEELAMAADDPGDYAMEEFAKAAFAGSELARPIGGTVESVSAIECAAVAEHYRTHYHAPALTVAAVGALDHEELCQLVGESLQAGGWHLAAGQTPNPRRPTQPAPTAPATSQTRNRPAEQANLLLGARALAARDLRRPTLSLLVSILGGGMSSRLFQEVREKRGLAYSTGAFDSSYSDAGVLTLFAGCAPAAIAQVTELMIAQWDDLAANGPTADELHLAAGQLEGSTALGLEDNRARMFRLGRAETIFGHLLPVGAIREALTSVTITELRALAAETRANPLVELAVRPQE